MSKVPVQMRVSQRKNVAMKSQLAVDAVSEINVDVARLMDAHNQLTADVHKECDRLAVHQEALVEILAEDAERPWYRRRPKPFRERYAELVEERYAYRVQKQAAERIGIGLQWLGVGLVTESLAATGRALLSASWQAKQAPVAAEAPAAS